MPSHCTWVDSVEIEPIADGNLHFTIISGDERMRFCMARGVARKTTEFAGRKLDLADVMDRNTVVNFERAS